MFRKFLFVFTFTVIFIFSWNPWVASTYDVSNSKTLTASEAAELFGDTLTVKYFNGTDYVEQTATLDENPVRAFGMNPNLTDRDEEVFDFSIYYLRYVLPKGANTNPSYITIDFNPTSTFKNTEFLVTAVAVGNQASGNGGAISNTFASSTADIFVDGQKQQFTSFDNGDMIQGVKFSSSSASYTATVVPINLSLTKKSTVVLDRCCFYGTAGKYIYIRIPTVSLDTVAEPGDTSGSGGSGGSGSVDLEETNGLLGVIVGWLQSVFDGIAAIPSKIGALFIPSEESLIAFKDDMSQLLDDHFGGLAESVDIIDDFASRLPDAQAAESIYFPQVKIWDGLYIGGFDIPLKISGMEILFTSLALIIDIIATCLFVNSLRRRFENTLADKDGDTS